MALPFAVKASPSGFAFYVFQKPEIVQFGDGMPGHEVLETGDGSSLLERK